MANHQTSPRPSTEVRERVRMVVVEHRTGHTSQWAAITGSDPHQLTEGLTQPSA